MIAIALKILRGDKAKYIGILLGIAFSSFIVTQQAAIFIGLMQRTYGFVTDTSQPDLWVMPKFVRQVEDPKALNDTSLYQVRGISGVDWAVPMYKGQVKVRLKNGNFQGCTVVGIDDSTLIGGPSKMLEGKIENLRITDGVILNHDAAYSKLAFPAYPGGPAETLKVGDIVELNDKRGQIVGICDSSKTFQTNATFYTTYSRALSFAPPERRMLTFVLVKAKEGLDPKKLAKEIESKTDLVALTRKEFKELTFRYYIQNTGIPVNFGIAVFMGLVIGAAIAGQTFFNFVIDTIRFLAVFKAMGASNRLILKMTLAQVGFVGVIGWGIGVGAASLFGFLSRKTELAFVLPWQLLVGSALAMAVICLLTCFFSVRRVFKADLAIVFKT